MCATRDFRTAGRNAKFVFASDHQSTSSIFAFSDINSINPALAWGANSLVSEGLRRSPSTKTARPPD